MKEEIIEYCDSVDNDLFIDESFDNCLIGVCYRHDEYYTPAYDLNKIIEKIMVNESISNDDAINFFNTNILSKYTTPSFILFKTDNVYLFNENMYLFSDLSSAFIGVRFKNDCNVIATYDEALCISGLCDEGMDEMDAIEYFDFNTKQAFIGENTPCILTLIHDYTY